MYISRIFWYGIIPFISHMITYWGTSYLFGLLDCYTINKRKQKHWKIQPSTLPRTISAYKKLFNKLEQDHEFKSLFSFNNVFLYPILKEFLQKHLLTHVMLVYINLHQHILIL